MLSLRRALIRVRMPPSVGFGSDNKPPPASAARNTRMGMLAWDAAEELAQRYEDGKHDAESVIEVMANAQAGAAPRYPALLLAVNFAAPVNRVA